MHLEGEHLWKVSSLFRQAAARRVGTSHVPQLPELPFIV